VKLYGILNSGNGSLFAFSRMDKMQEELGTLTAYSPQPDDDWDDDGVPNNVDQCPLDWGPPENDGCPVQPEPRPRVSVSVAPAANAAGWNNEPVTIDWTTTPASAVRSGSCVTYGDPETIGFETAGLTRWCTATNSSGSDTEATGLIKTDFTAPGITGSWAPPPNAYGWNNESVNVHFECSDNLSGVASCPADVGVTNEGRNQYVSGTAWDYADNSRSTTVGPINIDKTPPVTTATLDPPAPNGKRGWYISDVTVCLPGSDPQLADGSPGSGVRETLYQVNSGGWQTYAGCFVVGTESKDNLVEFYSADYADNVEPTRNVHFKLDKTPPEKVIREGILDGLHWDLMHLERGVLTNTDTLALFGEATDNLCLWEVRAINDGSLADSQPGNEQTFLSWSLDIPLHVGINTINVIAEDCAGWERDPTIKVVYVTPGPYDPRTIGFWYNAVGTGKYTPDQMQTLLDYINVVSDVFGPAARNIYGLVTLDSYRGILAPSSSDMETLQKAQLLGSWLNLVSGRVAVLTPADLTKVKGWARVVDNTGGSPLTFALNVPMEVEEVDQTRLATRGVYEIAKNLLEAFNIRKIIP
jgi:hypothetical protein